MSFGRERGGNDRHGGSRQTGSPEGKAGTGSVVETAGQAEDVLEMNRADAETWNSLGVVLLLEGDTARAADAFRDALSFDPGYPDAHRNLAAALDKEGRPGEAVAHYEAFLHLSAKEHPDRDDVRRRLAELFAVSGTGPTGRRGWIPLGEMMLEDGVLTQEQLAEALERQQRTRERLGQILIEMKLIDQEILLRYLSRQFRKEAISQQDLKSLDLDVVKLVPEEVARRHGIISAERHGRKLVVATSDPLNVVALDDLRRVSGLEVDFKIGAAQDIQEAIDLSYRRLDRRGDDLDRLRQDLGLDIGGAAPVEESVDVQELRTRADDQPVVKVVNYMLTRAAADGASDVHVEAYADRTRIRYRVDGLLFDLLEMPRSLHLAVVSRLKIISRLDIAERRLPQDGSFASSFDGRELDFRVSTLPALHGETVVLRLLEKDAVLQHYSLESLGFDPLQLELFTRAIRRPWGMVLLTGPTGSGKSTTLHTALKVIKSPRKKIITVEDPIEYRQPDIQQVQVKNEIGFDFARSLRAILRQDPDIIMVGEIRDAETAQIAVRAALTGHLVLSTLHTNDAVSTLVRLINIGVEPFLVASAVNVAAAQRLVKKICTRCKEAYRPSAEEAALFAPDPAPELLYRGSGCADCRNIGYAGRMALYEVFSVNAHVRRMIIDGAEPDQVRMYAAESGMVGLRQAGLRRVRQGETTVEEVMAVAADQD